MDLFKQEMKGPSRPAPAVPKLGINRYSPVTNWNDDPFGADVFEPTPQFVKKKVPPPRPPPPRVSKYPEVPAKPSHFIRKPTVLTSLLSRKKAASNTNNMVTVNQHTNNEFGFEMDTNRVFPKCEPKNLQTGTLIDLSSPPSSPTFTTRSSSDGLSVDSFGSDATNSTNHANANNGGNASQSESGFEDDFDLFLNSRKRIPKDDTLEDFTTVDPFSPQPALIKPPIMRKPVFDKDLCEAKISSQHSCAGNNMKGPTIIRAKPARPKPPDNSALLKNTFGNSFPSTLMNVNTTTPIQKMGNYFADNFNSKPPSWESSPERESSPPMPSIPPPPPPRITDEDSLEWPVDVDAAGFNTEADSYEDEAEKPYGVALFDYFTDHPDDLCFSVNSRINLIRRVDADWLYGSLRNGAEGLFPSNYVDIKVPLPNDVASAPSVVCVAKALYDFEGAQPGDLKFLAGDTITVLHKLSDEWYFGQCNAIKGQFPVNYVQMC